MKKTFEKNQKLKENDFFNYFNYKNKKYKIGIVETIFVLILTCLCSFFLGFYFRDKYKYGKEIILDDSLNKFIDNYNYIVDNYYQDVDKNQLIDDAISGMMESLDDPYSVYLDSSKNSNINIALNGKYNGLGLAVAKNDETNYIEVVNVFKKSSADKNGVLEGDIIKSINGKDVSALSISEFSSLVINSSENKFILLISRDGKDQNIIVEKSSVVINSVISDIIEMENIKIGYIYISVFASNTATQFFNEIKKLEASNINYLIIDVRNNTGGYLTTVETILKRLLTTKQIAYQLKKDNDITKIYGSAKNNKQYPIILLGNEYSASASEMLISGLKENLNCKFFGNQTYGKGTVQEMITIDNKAKYKITTKKWLTPLGNWVNDSQGVLPDYSIDASSFYYENYDMNADDQLNYAIQYIINEEK